MTLPPLPLTLADSEIVAAAVQETAAAFGLLVVLETTLKTRPGSRHWHCKRGKTAGVLEVTYVPQENVCLVSYHSHRAGEGWVVQTAVDFAAQLGIRLAEKDPGHCEK